MPRRTGNGIRKFPGVVKTYRIPIRNRIRSRPCPYGSRKRACVVFTHGERVRMTRTNRVVVTEPRKTYETRMRKIYGTRLRVRYGTRNQNATGSVSVTTIRQESIKGHAKNSFLYLLISCSRVSCPLALLLSTVFHFLICFLCPE
jgi:hypothetical protein